jgi:quinoprotein glucose dehydrogenase
MRSNSRIPASSMKTGTPSEGGCIATAGDLVFIAATLDAKFRAFDSKSGKVLWEAKLSVPGLATPCTYEAGGKQYVCIAAGGGFGGAESSDEFVAFALG